ncbi:MAG TPA: YceI family protein [Panacibacter sp.]|nr:YceI family protein [Panacibacter sp.]
MVRFKPKITTTGILIAAIFFFTGFNEPSSLYQTNNGTVSFRSEAPLELIKASSSDLIGVIDNEKRVFAFEISVRSFQGFNTALQKQHFHENYMETDKYAEAYFKGRIIEDQDLEIDGTYEIRAKGKLTIHNVTQERIIRSTVTVSNKKLTLKSNFTVLLSDYNIPIPRVVYQKLANEIKVEVNATLTPR